MFYHPCGAFPPEAHTGANLLFMMRVRPSHLPFSEWPEIFGDERLAGALIERLTHHVHVVEVQGESYRLKSSLAARSADGGQNPSSAQERGAETPDSEAW